MKKKMTAKENRDHFKARDPEVLSMQCEYAPNWRKKDYRLCNKPARFTIEYGTDRYSMCLEHKPIVKRIK